MIIGHSSAEVDVVGARRKSHARDFRSLGEIRDAEDLHVEPRLLQSLDKIAPVAAYVVAQPEETLALSGTRDGGILERLRRGDGDDDHCPAVVLQQAVQFAP